MTLLCDSCITQDKTPLLRLAAVREMTRNIGYQLNRLLTEAETR